MCFVLVECETFVCFYEYDFESLYDPLGTFEEENTFYTDYTVVHLRALAIV